METISPTVDASDGAPRRRTIRLHPPKGFGTALHPAELWRFRDVAVQIAARDIKVRYRQTAFGAAWAILQPVSTMVFFWLFFGRVAHLPSEGVSYPLFSLAGLVPWTFFSTSLTLAADSMVSNAALVAKIYFPRIFIPGAVVAAGLVDLTIGLVVLVIASGASGIAPAPSILVLPVLVLITVATAVGVGSGLAALNVRYRDVRYVVPLSVQLWLFATPIAYPSTLVREPWRTLWGINPLAGVVEGFRWGVLHSSNDPWPMIGVSAVSATLLLLIGLAYFGRVERGFADVV